jgi:uncharacterized Zn finger protein (UPF0148 family)
MSTPRSALALVPPPPADTRTCSKCGLEKFAADFKSPKRGKVCADCDRQRLQEWRAKNPERMREAYRRYHATDHGKAYRRQQQNERRQSHPEESLFQSARQRARRDAVEFAITVRDILIPPCCPVLGIPLERRVGAKGPQDSSPSIDRLDPAKGYTRENIAVISIRANRIKNDANIEDLERVVAWVRAAQKRST